MKLDLKAHLLSMLNSHEVKELVCDLLDQLVKMDDNTLDDDLAKGVRYALLKQAT